MVPYKVEEYLTSDGKSPFGDWLIGLRDKVAKAKITARIRRASFGYFGDWKSIKEAKGLFEMREHHGAGYRVYYAVERGKILLLLAGSTKGDQGRMIEAAKGRLEDYRNRNPSDEEAS